MSDGAMFSTHFQLPKGTELSQRRPITKTVVFFLSRAYLNRIIKCNRALQLPILHSGSFKVPCCLFWLKGATVFMKNGLRFWHRILSTESVPFLENARLTFEILHFLLLRSGTHKITSLMRQDSFPSEKYQTPNLQNILKGGF